MNRKGPILRFYDGSSKLFAAVATIVVSVFAAGRMDRFIAIGTGLLIHKFAATWTVTNGNIRAAVVHISTFLHGHKDYSFRNLDSSAVRLFNLTDKAHPLRTCP